MTENTVNSHDSTDENRSVTIVTGASSGLGAEFARQIAVKFASQKERHDEELWLLARSKDKLDGLKAELEKSLDAESRNADSAFLSIKIFEIDLCGKQGVGRFENILRKESETSPFTIKLLVNNAGFGTYGPFSETPLEKEMEMIELNCTSLTGVTGLCIGFMKRKSGIINVASLAAFMPLGNFAVYAASKSYVLSFSVALAAELSGRGISVSALCPGSVSTNFANVASNGARKEVLHGKDPKKVVAHCLKKAGRNKKIILWAKQWKITAFLSRFAGRYIVAWSTFKFNRRPYQK